MSYMSHFSLLLWYQGNVYDNKRTFCPPFMMILDITVNRTLSQSGGVLLYKNMEKHHLFYRYVLT